ncbi:ATP binding cassette subfamily B MDR TAP [Fasciola hepatica]|uniref:ATP binding cassette subfamily B MDR TAP n=1 Tax=Fasciola hepatica TaxID=6192 RepID=A0A4E0R4E4_FASHE|nr:ATP binding cassette subfamily B MDR TAP [Fasciola hepatica]
MGDVIGETTSDGKKSKKEKRSVGVPYFQLFKYSDRTEKILIILGGLCSAAVGTGEPLSFFLFGDMVDSLSGQAGINTQNIYRTAIYFALLGLLVLIVGFVQVFCFHYSSLRQTQRIRQLYFSAVLRQNIAWFDGQSSGSLISQLSENIDNIEKGTGYKLGLFIQYLATFITGIVIGFVKGWKLTLVALATMPLTLIAFGVFAFVMQKFSKMESVAYAEAGAIAGEVLSAIRTVVAFGGEQQEHKRYVDKLGEAEKVGIKKSSAIGCVTGFMGFVIFASCALIFWYGIKLTVEENYNVGAVFIIFFNLILGTIALGSAMPNLEFFAIARASAVPIFETIDRIPPIDKEAGGKQLPAVTGDIEFRNVSFIYESRPDVTILENFNLKVKPGQTIAFVGPSGSGKSTVVHMLQRFYDPVEGQIFINGTEIRQLDLLWYRSQLGVVQQEPVLFAGTVAENITMGYLNATREQIEEAAKLANAHEFIMKLPEGYDTWIAEGGGSMSGGQKQRIAIARALVRNPKIMLLDEATSALDTRSERQVQAALDKACSGRTVMMIAHRLTTVQNADCILVIEKGRVRESGTHRELLKAGGLYSTMLRAQGKQDEVVEEEEEDDELYEKPSEDLILTPQKQRRSMGKADLTQGSLLSVASEVPTCVSQSDMQYKALYSMKRMMRYSRPEVGFTIGGCIGAIMAALVNPGFVLLYAEIFQLFNRQNITPPEILQASGFYAGMMVVLALGYLIGMAMEGIFFGFVGERLTRRLRDKMFGTILKQEIGWFDRVENQPGVLTSRLATEASTVRTVSGFQLAILLEGLVLVLSAFVIGFVDCWQVTLLLLAFVPFIVIGGYLEYRAFFDEADAKGKKTEGAQIAQECFIANRTVTTLSLEKYFSDKFVNTLEADKRNAMKKNITFSLMHAFSRAVNFFSYATAFPLGAYLIENQTITSFQLFRAFSAVTFSLSATGRVVAFIPDMRRAIDAAKKILILLDRVSLIPKEDGFVPNELFDGRVVIKNIKFRYPTRIHVPVLRGFTHSVEANQTHALVGQSGCGKSTVLQLLLRFYDPINAKSQQAGIFLNGRNTVSLAPWWIRRQIGLVSQEPNLFNMSVRENISFGVNFREATMDEIIDAAKKANIHDFIMTLPEGYETSVGERGSKLSGGQKQRVAIARALIRQPQLLLLDEATSALDNESERLVQAALDEAMGQRTCLVIAHRLTTVEVADQIVVLDNGRLREKGTASELMAAKGAYYALHSMEN